MDYRDLEDGRDEQTTTRILFEAFRQVLVDLPMVSMSIDLDSELERRHFLIPDAFMLFLGWDSIAAEVRTASAQYPW